MAKKTLRIMKSLLLRLILKYPFIPFREALLRQYGWRSVQSISLQSACKSKIAVTGETSFIIEGPQWYKYPAKQYSGTYPAIGAHLLKDAVVSAYSTGVVEQDHLLLPENVLKNWERIRTPGYGIFEPTPPDFLAATQVDIEIPQAILIGGAGAFNWYHFIMECLPKAFLADRLPAEFNSTPFLVPEECISISSFADATKIFAENRPLIPLSITQRARVGQLIVFDEVSVGPFNMKEGEWPQVGDYSQHDEVLKSFIEKFRSYIHKDHASSDPNRKVFLARPGARRNFNQNELIEIAQKYGIQPVYLEKLSLSEQAKVFSEASVIIGPSGAAWTGMIFSERPFIGLSWLPTGYKEFSSYSTLANLLGHRLTFIEAKTRHELTSTGGAHIADYFVSPREFENAIQRVLGELAP
jgi:hypothetical protein